MWMIENEREIQDTAAVEDRTDHVDCSMGYPAHLTKNWKIRSVEPSLRAMALRLQYNQRTCPRTALERLLNTVRQALTAREGGKVEKGAVETVLLQLPSPEGITHPMIFSTTYSSSSPSASSYFRFSLAVGISIDRRCTTALIMPSP